jgi:hypothetical protein
MTETERIYNTNKRAELKHLIGNGSEINEALLMAFKELNIFTEALVKYDINDLYLSDRGNDFRTSLALAKKIDNTSVSEIISYENILFLIDELYPKSKEEIEEEERIHRETEVKEYYVFTYGKHKGKTITELTSPPDVSYCKWLLETKYKNKIKSKNKSTERKALEWWVKQTSEHKPEETKCADFKILTSGMFEGREIRSLTKPHELFHLEFLISDANPFRANYSHEKLVYIAMHLHLESKKIKEYSQNDKHIISKVAKIITDFRLKDSDIINISCFSPVYKKYGYTYHTLNNNGVDIYEHIDSVCDNFNEDYNNTPFFVIFEINNELVNTILEIYRNNNGDVKSIIIPLPKTSEEVMREVKELTEDGKYNNTDKIIKYTK